MPPNLDKQGLADALQGHPELRQINKATVTEGSDIDSVLVHALATDLRHSSQVATVRFRNLPTRLGALSKNDQLTIDLHCPSESTHAGDKRKLEVTKLTIDQHFDGITVLVSPPANQHQVDILAISGLGSHPFGSFMHKGDGHMWLTDSLPRDMPTARVMIYGYESGLQGSTNFASLEDFASSLYVSLCRLLQSEGRKRLVLIGHSLGGLLIKEALIRMAESDSKTNLLKLVSGCLLVGVPNDGMDIDSLTPMVSNQSNELLVKSLDATNSQILGLQRRNFSRILGQARLEIFCFYETKLSPTAVKVCVSWLLSPPRVPSLLTSLQDPATGRYEMAGPLRCLVTRSSATSCLPVGASSDHAVAIDRTHSDLVKFASHDSEYDKLIHVLEEICRRSWDIPTRPQAVGAGHRQISGDLGSPAPCRLKR